mmetsp:Transcript_101355/g.194328  ORF Transcript_101355/g.194328 Transcript_101355/m.194328 type:complete len:431 (-) Transcript_101355:41-1333(-)
MNSVMDVVPDSLRKWHRSSAFLMVLGPGLASALYVAMVGFYYLNFDSRLFFIGMLLSLYLPYLILPMLQHSLDTLFDDRFSTKTTYFFRIILMQLILGIVGLTWMQAPQSPRIVLFIGVALGTVAAAVLSSSFQMVTAMNPKLIIYAQVGEQIGGAIPILVFAVVGFDASSSLLKFKLALSALPLVCLFSAVNLSYIHFKTDVFEKAYQRLAYKDDPDNIGEYTSESLYTSEGLPSVTMSRSFSEAGYDPESARTGIPAWVWWWCTCTGIMTVIACFTLSLIPFYEDPSMAQQLALWKLGMDFVGRIAAIPLSSMTCFQSGPLHGVLLALAFSQCCLTAFPLAKLAKVTSGNTLFLITWCLFNCIHRFRCSFSAVTMFSYIHSTNRKLVAKTNLIVTIGSCLIGILIALAFVHAARGLHSKWPEMDKVIG